MKRRLLATLFAISLLVLTGSISAENRQMHISLPDAKEVIDAQVNAQVFVYFGKELELSKLAGQEIAPLDKLINQILKLAPEEKLATALENLTKRMAAGSVVAPKAMTLEALEAARSLLITYHDRVIDDAELKALNDQLEFYKKAIENDVLTITVSSEAVSADRAPRPPLDTGDEASTGDVGDTFEPVPASGFMLPDDVNVVHNLTVGNDVIIGGNLVINGTVTFHNDVILEPICPDTDIAVRFNTCTGTEIARIYTPSVVGGLAISTNSGVTENFRVQADGNSQTTGNLTITGVTYANGGVDRSTAAVLNLGTVNATGVNIGTGAATTVTIGNVANTTAVELPYGYVTTGGVRYINNFGLTRSFFAGALAGNTAVSNTGQNNTGTGAEVLTNLTSGQSNTASGCQALASLTTASFNTAIGFQALDSITTSNGNTAVGAVCLDGLTTGTLNTAIGYGAGSLLTTGNNNVNIGFGESGIAGESNTIRLGANAVLAANRCFIGGIDGTTLGSQAKLVGIAANQLGTTDASGFTLGGTLYTDSGIDTITATTLNLGTVNATGVNLGTGAATTDINIGSATTTNVDILGITTTIDGTTLLDMDGAQIDLGNTSATDINIGRAGATTVDVLGITTNVTGSTTAGIDGTTVNLGNTTATTINMGTTASTDINIGRAGTTTLDILGTTLNVTGTTTAVTGSTSARLDGLTVNVGDTLATGVNIGTTTATTITIGNVANTTAVELPYGYITTGSTRYIHNRGTNNFFAGVSAGNTATTGARNTGVGSTALTAITTGSDNTALGRNTLATLTTANELTAVGSGALAACTTGTSNTAVGFNTLTAITTGMDNTAMGHTALSVSNTSNNTAFGSAALKNVTANGNSALGAFALQNATTCAEATAVGYQSCIATTTGTQNTACGAYTLKANTTGGSSVAIGYNALLAATTGGSNIAVGSSAATGLLTGSNNIIVGNSSGSAYAGAESSNILINNAGVAAETNTIRIGTTGGGAGQQNRCFIGGITGAGPFANAVTINPADGQLGGIVSARRYKENIVPLDKQDRFMQLNPVSFTYKNDAEKSTWYGLIAEEVEPIYPELAVYGKDKQLESVSYHKLYGIIIKELQAAIERINALEKRLASLEQ